MSLGRKTRRGAAGFTWVEVAIAVSILGVLAAVAVPVMIHHERQSRTTEIPEKLALIYRGSVAYYIQTSRATSLREDGTPTPAVFPTGDGPTPAKRCCEAEDHLCSSDAEAWDMPTWKALRFSIRGQHQYQYTYESAGEGPLAHFTARATGDLDCDNVLGTFERTGTATMSLDIQPGRGIVRHNPLE